MVKASTAASKARTTPGSDVPAGYGEARGASLEQGLRSHQELAQGSSGAAVPGSRDGGFGVEPLARLAKQGSTDGGKAARRERSADSGRATPPPIASRAGGLPGQAAADHGFGYDSD